MGTGARDVNKAAKLERQARLLSELNGMTGIAAGAEAQERLGATVFGWPDDVSERSFA